MEIGRKTPNKFTLIEEQRNSYGKIVLLSNIYHNQQSFVVGCEGVDNKLNEWFISLLSDDLIEQKPIENTNYYTLTNKGREYLKKLEQRNNEFNIIYQLYKYIDLEKGIFAYEKFFELNGHHNSNNWFNYIESDNWTDLRCAIAYYKGLDPFDCIFLNMIWESDSFLKFNNNDLSIHILDVFSNLEDIVNNQWFWEELSGRNRDDNPYNDEELDYAIDVVQNIIKRGNGVFRSLLEKEEEINKHIYNENNNQVIQNDIIREEVVEETITEEVINNDYIDNYYNDPYYISPLWIAPIAVGVVAFALL